MLLKVNIWKSWGHRHMRPVHFFFWGGGGTHNFCPFCPNHRQPWKSRWAGGTGARFPPPPLPKKKKKKKKEKKEKFFRSKGGGSQRGGFDTPSLRTRACDYYASARMVITSQLNHQIILFLKRPLTHYWTSPLNVKFHRITSWIWHVVRVCMVSDSLICPFKGWLSICSFQSVLYGVFLVLLKSTAWILVHAIKKCKTLFYSIVYRVAQK